MTVRCVASLPRRPWSLWLEVFGGCAWDHVLEGIMRPCPEEAMQGSGLAAADFKVVVPPNVEVYLQALRNQDPKVRCAACWVLSYSAPAVVNLKGMADVLVQESNQVLLSVCAECMSLLKLAMLPAAPELVLCLKSFMSDAQSKLRAKNAPGAALMHLHQVEPW